MKSNWLEALGYGSKDSYKPPYQNRRAAGQSGQGLFDKLQHSLKNFKFLS
jgi:hypothetical protein